MVKDSGLGIHQMEARDATNTLRDMLFCNGIAPDSTTDKNLELKRALYELNFHSGGAGPIIQELSRFFYNPKKDLDKDIDLYLKTAEKLAEKGKRDDAQECCEKASLLALLSGNTEKVKKSYELGEIYIIGNLAKSTDDLTAYAFVEQLKYYNMIAENPKKAVEIVQNALQTCESIKEFQTAKKELEEALNSLKSSNGIAA